MYTVSREVVPLHVLCGQHWEIIGPDGTRFCVVAGTRENADAVCAQLNTSKQQFIVSLAERLALTLAEEEGAGLVEGCEKEYLAEFFHIPVTTWDTIK